MNVQKWTISPKNTSWNYNIPAFWKMFHFYSYKSNRNPLFKFLSPFLENQAQHGDGHSLGLSHNLFLSSIEKKRNDFGNYIPAASMLLYPLPGTIPATSARGNWMLNHPLLTGTGLARGWTHVCYFLQHTWKCSTDIPHFRCGNRGLEWLNNSLYTPF